MGSVIKRWFLKRFIPILFFIFLIGIFFKIFIEILIYNEVETGVRAPGSSDGAILSLTLAFWFSQLLLALVVGFLSFSFVKSIAIPVRKINESAKQIAQGDFSIKIKKQHNDEIGELCNTINYMAKELAEMEKIKNEFISSISHELRTPLTAVKGWAETIQNSNMLDFEVAKKGMSVIVDESERLCQMVEELLDFSTIKGSKITISMTKLDILAELGEAVYMFRDRAEQEKKFLLYSEPENFPPVYGDKNRLRQTFINIIDNALKYTPEGGVVNVSARTQEDFISIVVDDNGCGIPSACLPRVKEKFYKANKTQIGAGIGLAIANKIVSLHSGKLEIKSEEGVGTSVNISIPVMKDKKEVDCREFP
ncbi:MAG: HAMP domain-containing histidine kinase [Oscillospiraceae bacterium]|nr:HAMP domain-containing histidine kinase [Oscillospiraceae bacterium]